MIGRLAVFAALLLIGCSAGADKLARTKLQAPPSIELSSPAFGNGQPIPAKYAGSDDVSPPINWANVPENAKSLVLIVEDPDAPTPNPFVHWIVYNIPPNIPGLPERIKHDEDIAKFPPAKQGQNSMLKTGYYHPAPPRGSRPHHYHFQLFALNKLLPLKAGAGRSELVSAMKKHVLARGELVGTYENP
jgi:Raf kinase inhibitor-like YbhB/YbcL family protein